MISDFIYVRDLPYRIPLSVEEEDTCCNGKHILLKNKLAQKGHKARFRVCEFNWSSLNLPDTLSAIPHEDASTHVYLEVWSAGNWLVVDATWDKALKNLFTINEWDGKSNTTVAVKYTNVYSPQKSAEIMEQNDKDAILQDFAINGNFYKAFNTWLESNRKN